MSLLAPGSKLGRFRDLVRSRPGGDGRRLPRPRSRDRPAGRDQDGPSARRAGGESAHEIEARFLKEAKLAGRLQHPEHRHGLRRRPRGRDLFIAMEYVDGRPLTALPRSLRRPDARGARSPSSGRSPRRSTHAHERGVLHRDIKPGNILVDARRPREGRPTSGSGSFTDAATSDLTRTGQMIGSPAYMSPEQVRGEKLDGRSDLFSLGVVLYELLTRRAAVPRRLDHDARLPDPPHRAARSARAASRTCRPRRARSSRGSSPSRPTGVRRMRRVF